MATVRIKLDKKKSNLRKDGTYPIKMIVEHNAKHLSINLKIYSKIDTWKNGKLTSKYVGFKKINLELQNKLTLAENILNDFEVEIKSWSCKQLRDFIFESLGKQKIAKREKTNENNLAYIKGVKTIKLHEYGNKLISHLEDIKSIPKAKAYKQALSSFKIYTNCSDDITFSEITTQVLEKWRANMKNKQLKDSTYTNYLKYLRAIINQGIKQHKLPKEGNYGYDGFIIGGVQETKKRAINLDEIRTMFELQIEIGSALWKTQQLAIFMFNNGGMNFKDLVSLQLNQIIGDYDRIQYTRSKTGKKFDNIVSGKSKEILKYFVDGRELNSNELVFNLIPNESIGTGKEEYNKTMRQLAIFNENLKEIGELSNVKTNLTSYVLRHSFATGLKHSGVDQGIISEQLGHKNIQQTMVYLDSFDTEVKDEASKLIAF